MHGLLSKYQATASIHSLASLIRSSLPRRQLILLNVCAGKPKHDPKPAHEHKGGYGHTKPPKIPWVHNPKPVHEHKGHYGKPKHAKGHYGHAKPVKHEHKGHYGHPKPPKHDPKPMHEHKGHYGKPKHDPKGHYGHTKPPKIPWVHNPKPVHEHKGHYGTQPAHGVHMCTAPTCTSYMVA